ncbi:alpha/beta fold hydrolase [Nocardia sp. CA-119907]|uniref:alpha/beta fold hydrolase n=1 Tax=Nocardia sp. CA-119907 TaxID=3239973 RepID=UPI003D96DEED
MTDTERHTQGISEWVTTRDGRRLHAKVLPGPTYVAGASGPTVVFEADATGNRVSWARVQPIVAALMRAIVYDRSGLGRSAPDPADRSLDRMAEDLNEVLDHFGPGPFILVGHGTGGPIVRLAAARKPQRITGIVLVDATDEAAEVIFDPRLRRTERIFAGAAGVLARLRLLALVFRWQWRDLPTDVRRELKREGFTPSVIRTRRQQSRTYFDELATWRTAPPDLGSIPITAISGGLGGNGIYATVRAETNAAHAHRAARSPRGRHVIAERSGHEIPLTEGSLIAREIHNVFEDEIRRRGTT